MHLHRLQSYGSCVMLLIFGLILLPQFVYGTQTILDVNFDKTENDILDAAYNARAVKTCRSCQALLLPLKQLANIGDDRFVSAMVKICKARKLQDPDVCEGDIGSQGPIIAHALRSISLTGRTSRQFCNALFGICELEPVEPYNMTLPPKEYLLNEAKTRLRVEGRKPFHVIHLSDVHIDREYVVGSEANCTKYICCRNFTSDNNSEANVMQPAEPYGNRYCDSPIILANSMLRAINELVPDAKFAISSGDVVDHANWLLTQETVERGLHGFHEQLFANLSNSIPFYGSIGNHDTYPTNGFPRTTSSDTDGAKWVFELLFNDWKRWIGSSGPSVIQHQSGSYSVVPLGTDLKLISINTQYWYKFNFWIYDSDEFQPDPNGILSFLVNELDASERAGQRVWIFGHIPPGSGDMMRDQSNYYNQIVLRYKEIIAGQFFGHTHWDQFQVAYTNYSEQVAENAMSFGLIAPSLTPTNGNPAFTVYDVDPDTYDIMDIQVYIANMSEATYQQEPKWKLYYSARDVYGPVVASYVSSSAFSDSTPLDAAFWHNLTEVFEIDSKTFNGYIDRMGRSAWSRHCNERCRNNTICDIRAMRAENNCYNQSLNGIIIPPPREYASMEVMRQYPHPQHALPPSEGEPLFEGVLDAHNACEGSALPLIMRRLVSWS